MKTLMFNKKDHVLILTELPNVNKENVRLDLKDRILLLEAGSANKKYTKEFLLPAKVDFVSKKVNFKENGLLELKFKKVISN